MIEVLVSLLWRRRMKILVDSLLELLASVTNTPIRPTTAKSIYTVLHKVITRTSSVD